VGLITIRIINEGLGLKGYGEIALILAWIGGISLFDFGLLSSISRFTAKVESQDKIERQKFWTSCYFLLLTICAAQILITIGLVSAIKIGNFDISISYISFFFICLILILSNILTFGSAIFAGNQRYLIAGLGKVSKSSLYLLGILIIWNYGKISVENVLWTTAVTSFIPNLFLSTFSFACFKQTLIPVWPQNLTIQLYNIRQTLTFSFYGLMTTLTSFLIYSGSISIAGFFASKSSIGKLQIAYTIFSSVCAFLTGAMTPLTTICARLDQNCEKNKYLIFKSINNLVTETTLLIGIAFGLFVFADTILEKIIGKEYEYESVSNLLRLLMFVILVPGLLSMPWFIFRFTIVEFEENKKYNTNLLIGCLFMCTVAFTASIYFHNIFILAILTGFFFVFRSFLAYSIGNIKMRPFKVKIIRPLIFNITKFVLLAVLIKESFIFFGVKEKYINYFVVCFYLCISLFFYFLFKHTNLTKVKN
jgi:O-antigen/teichoic acid export membrane protein